MWQYDFQKKRKDKPGQKLCSGCKKSSRCDQTFTADLWTSIFLAVFRWWGILCLMSSSGISASMHFCFRVVGRKKHSEDLNLKQLVRRSRITGLWKELCPRVIGFRLAFPLKFLREPVPPHLGSGCQARSWACFLFVFLLSICLARILTLYKLLFAPTLDWGAENVWSPLKFRIKLKLTLVSHAQTLL